MRRPLEPDPVDLGGYYTTFLRLEGRERWSGDSTAWVALRCEGGVALVLADGDGILQGGFTRGDLACWFGLEPDPRPIPWASPVAGERRGAQVTLDDGYCRYTATLDAQVAHRVAGDVVCDSDSGATVLDLTGTWEATR